MCGINGIFAYHYAANPIDAAELLRTRDHMAARGPDGKGEWISDDGRIGFGHRRLSIIDLSEGGAQPMTSADGRYVITFNGEIYNYKELRAAMIARGRIFRSQSDTEILLQLYADKGRDMVHDLRGMFAFAIYDTIEGTLFLARDPYGIKPVYYSDDGWTFRFASQVKALLAGGAVSREPEPAGQVGFYLFGSVPEPFTTYLTIRAVPAGATLFVDRIGARAPVAYHSIAQVLSNGEISRTSADSFSVARSALLDSVRHHLVADVKVGAFLSAGIDSGALVGLMRDAGQHEIKTVTLTFQEFHGTGDDEAPLAETVARLYGADHETRVVDRQEFEADLPRILNAMDQPSIDGINTWFVSKAAHEAGLKVAISGLGGDELFAGYPSFRDVPRWVRRLRPFHFLPPLPRLSRLIAANAGGAFGIHPKLASLFELGGTYPGAYLLRRGVYMPWELDALADREFVARGLERLAPLEAIANALTPAPRTPQAKVAALEASLYMRNQLLRDTDWASMAHSLEVRVPLVDSVLLGKCAPLAGLSKSLLAASPTTKLPPSIVARSKTGFRTPILDWMLTHADAPPKKEHRAHAMRRYAQFVAKSNTAPPAA